MLDIRSSVICDDIRQEIGGKMILIGTYSAISVPFFPFKFSTFGIYIEATPQNLNYQRGRIAMFDPNAKVLAVAEGPYAFNVVGVPGITWARFADITFEVPGEHRI